MISAAQRAKIPLVNADRSMVSDAALVEAARRGDMRAFERLYRLHSGRVMGAVPAHVPASGRGGGLRPADLRPGLAQSRGL